MIKMILKKLLSWALTWLPRLRLLQGGLRLLRGWRLRLLLRLLLLLSAASGRREELEHAVSVVRQHLGQVARQRIHPEEVVIQGGVGVWRTERNRKNIIIESIITAGFIYHDG